MKKPLIIFAIVLIILLMSVFQAGCNNKPEIPEAPPEASLTPYRISPEEASVVMGASLPLPTYLPEGYNVTGIYVLEHNDYSEHMVLLISDETIGEKQLPDMQSVPWKIKMNVTLYRRGQVGGLKLVGKWFKIGSTDGVLLTRETTNDLWWIFPYPEPPGQYEIKLSAIKEIPEEELVTIARSVIVQVLNISVEPNPGTSLAEGIILDQAIVKIGSLDKSAFIPQNDRHYYVGDRCLLVLGDMRNDTDEDLYVDLWAEGFDSGERQVTWSISSGTIIGHVQYYIPHQSSESFEITINWAEDVQLIKIIANSYDRMIPSRPESK